MEAKAKLRNLRIAPRKVRLVADMVRGKKVPEVRNILSFTVNRPSEPVLKLLNSAVSGAKNVYDLKEESLYVAKIIVNEGTKLKRWMPRARGSASPIQKKTSHIEIILKEVEGAKLKKKTIKDKAVGSAVKKEDATTPPVAPTEETYGKKKKTSLKVEKDSGVKLKKGGAPSRIFRRKSI